MASWHSEKSWSTVALDGPSRVRKIMVRRWNVYSTLNIPFAVLHHLRQHMLSPRRVGEFSFGPCNCPLQRLAGSLLCCQTKICRFRSVICFLWNRFLRQLLLRLFRNWKSTNLSVKFDLTDEFLTLTCPFSTWTLRKVQRKSMEVINQPIPYMDSV